MDILNFLKILYLCGSLLIIFLFSIMAFYESNYLFLIPPIFITIDYLKTVYGKYGDSIDYLKNVCYLIKPKEEVNLFTDIFVR